eukprot:scaffold25693_cov229-Skeletonema_marinoi.AAC.2
MTRQRPRSSSSFRFLLLPLLLSFLFTLHGVFLTRNLISSNDDAKYFNEDDDSQWRLNVMMGRGAPFDNRLDGMAADDFDVPSSPDGGGDTYDDGAPAEEQFWGTADDEIMNQNGLKSLIANKRRGTYNNNDSDTNDGDTAADSLKEKLRPKRNPKGHRFRGWMHPKEFNFWAAQSQNNNDSENNNNNSSDDRAAWWRNNRLCFEIDYICHRPQSNTWAYMTSSKWKQNVFQPTMELKPSAWKYDGGRYNAELRVGIKVDSPSRKRMERGDSGDDSGEEFSFDTCQLSTTDTHVVLQSVFNDMVGEFYSRSLLGLHQTMMMGVQQDDDDNQNDDDNSTDNDEAKSSSQSLALPWEQDIQFYIHIPLQGKEVLDGHKLFTAGMLANSNAGMPMSFLDLFQPPENVEDDCQCYRKMVFCGYDVYTHDEQVNSEDIDTVEHYDKKTKEDDEEEEMESNPGDDKVGSDEEDVKQANSNKKTSTDLLAVSDNSPSFNPSLKYTLWSSGTVAEHKKDTINCNRGEKCQGYANLRSLMSSNFVKHYPSLIDDIVKFRREALLAKSLISDDYSGDTKEWLVVGLTQRTYRRAWLNLPTVMKQCNTKLNGRRVIFIEVNVEDTSSPYEQLILHRSLDVMIGVHGAQLTQAVVLPPHAHVLEILPWVPSYIRGNWVTRRDAPTPLGIIYHNTDLNHAGYSLDRSSTDLCVGVGEVGSEEEKDCFLGQRKIFIWDNRDFNVEPEVIIQYIEKLVLFMRDDEMGKLCAEVKDRLDERFVLYNVWCADEEEESTLSVSHYYAEAGPTAEGEQYGMGRRKKLKMAKDE